MKGDTHEADITGSSLAYFEMGFDRCGGSDNSTYCRTWRALRIRHVQNRGDHFTCCDIPGGIIRN